MSDSRLHGLVTALRSSDGGERRRARETLVLIGSPAIPLLEALLSDRDRLVRWEAAKTLTAMIEPDNVERFVALLSDERSEIRWLAASGLIALGPRSVVPVLRALTQDAASRGRREMSHRVLKELSADNSVLAQLLKPVTEVLRGDDPAPVASRAARALSDWEELTRY
jgi:hypothetical protein